MGGLDRRASENPVPVVLDLLGKPTLECEHHAAMARRQVAAFLARVHKDDVVVSPSVRLAPEFLVLTNA